MTYVLRGPAYVLVVARAVPAFASVEVAARWSRLVNMWSHCQQSTCCFQSGVGNYQHLQLLLVFSCERFILLCVQESVRSCLEALRGRPDDDANDEYANGDSHRHEASESVHTQAVWRSLCQLGLPSKHKCLLAAVAEAHPRACQLQCSQRCRVPRSKIPREAMQRLT